MRVDELHYDLPEDRIAQHPLAVRDEARLLVVPRFGGAREHRRVKELPELVAPGDLLVVNDTKVFAAKLHGTKVGSGARIELLLLRRPTEGACDALARPGKRLRVGDRIAFGEGMLVARVEGAEGRLRKLRFEGVPRDVEASLDRLGEAPLPPYIRRPVPEPSDLGAYQTLFARRTGAIAAPTAGLHFTPALVERLAARGAGIASVTLHVGWGTFAPVEVDDLAHHKVEPEEIEVPSETLAALRGARAAGRRVIAVGTTTARALESLEDGEAAGEEGVRRWSELTILPGHRFRRIDALLTNFHLPCSSLLALVAAFAGRDVVLAAYADAIEHGYRFYSYGDASLFI